MTLDGAWGWMYYMLCAWAERAPEPEWYRAFDVDGDVDVGVWWRATCRLEGQLKALGCDADPFGGERFRAVRKPKHSKKRRRCRRCRRCRQVIKA